MTAEKKVLRTICGDCKYLGVTYQRQNPWKCDRFGFKSKELPARVVLQATGTECALYTLKAPIVRKSK